VPLAFLKRDSALCQYFCWISFQMQMTSIPIYSNLFQSIPIYSNLF
jgi:hypothetical protein